MLFMQIKAIHQIKITTVSMKKLPACLRPCDPAL